jgi:hypothetical protein
MKTYYKLKERNNMRNVFITTVAAMAISTAAFAEDTVTKVTPMVAAPVLSGEVSLDFAETANDKFGGTMNLDLGVDMGGLATIDLDFEATDGNAITLDTWAVGTTVAGVGVAVGDDLGVMPGAEGEQTLAAPAMAEAVQVTVGDAVVAVGLTDWTADITDVSNIQGAYTMDVAGLDVTAAADYNLDSENTVLGAGVGGLDLGLATVGGAMTYDVDAETFGYEGVAAAYGVTAYLNGDDTDMLQNIGGEYAVDVAGATFTAGANYNIDTEDFAPTAGISFNF